MASITVNLDDGVFTDKNNELEYYTKALASGLVSREYAIQKALGVSEEEAKKMIVAIQNEAQVAANQARTQEDIDIYGE